MKNIFDKNISDNMIERINQLSSDSKAEWGKMSVDQMLAHCCITYEFIFDNNHPKPKGFKKWILKAFVKSIVVNEKPYKKNGRTAPEFIMNNRKDFELEKSRLIAYIINCLLYTSPSPRDA